MFNTVKVWNDNVHPFKQKFRGEEIVIPAKGYIEMDYEDAFQFKSKGSPMKFDGMNQQTPESYKMIRVEGSPKLNEQVVAYKCHLDGSLHSSKAALEAYESSLSEDKFADDDVRKTKTKKSG